MAFSDDLTTAVLPLTPGDMTARRVSDTGSGAIIVWTGPDGELLRICVRDTGTYVSKPDGTREEWVNKYDDADVQTLLTSKTRGETGF
jgi:hypothetical protein